MTVMNTLESLSTQNTALLVQTRIPRHMILTRTRR